MTQSLQALTQGTYALAFQMLGKREDAMDIIQDAVAVDRMLEDAAKLGANAILEVRFTTSVITRNAAELLAYGTAVIVEDK